MRLLRRTHVVYSSNRCDLCVVRYHRNWILRHPRVAPMYQSFYDECVSRYFCKDLSAMYPPASDVACLA